MVEEHSEAKRRRLVEQRTAFEEDMARVRAAMQNDEPGCDVTGDQSQTDAGALSSEQVSRQHLSTSTNDGNDSRGDSDDEEGGNWLKNFTAHHTRIGEHYQVTDLPIPSPKK